MPRCTSTPGVVPGDQDHALLAVPLGGRVGLAHHDEDLAAGRSSRRTTTTCAPLMTYSSPSRSIRVAMLFASDDATSGSVMQNADRISPASSGVEPALLLRSGVPNSASDFHVARCPARRS